MPEQDFPVEVGRGGTHFELVCIRLQLLILFILDKSADYFLHQSINYLLCQNYENREKCRHSDSEPKVTPSLCLFSENLSSRLRAGKAEITEIYIFLNFCEKKYASIYISYL